MMLHYGSEEDTGKVIMNNQNTFISQKIAARSGRDKPLIFNGQKMEIPCRLEIELRDVIAHRDELY